MQSFRVKLKLFDVNGEYAEKTVTDTEPLYDVTDKNTINKKLKDGYSLTEYNKNGVKRDVLVRTVTKKVHAFPRNNKNQPLIPLGTARGYICGVLCSIARDIGVKQGQPLYGFLSWVKNGGVKVTPYWVAAKVSEVKTVNFFVKEAKQKMYYEQIPETTVNVNVEIIPRDGFNEDLVKELMKRGQGVGISPKRRGRYEILEFS